MPPAAVLLAAALVAGCASGAAPVPVEGPAPGDAGAGRFAPRVAAPPALPEPDGDGVLRLSLEQAVLLALRNNQDLAVETLRPVVAGTFAEIERADFDPEVFARLQFGREVASETDRATGGRFDVKGRDSLAEAGVRQDLPTGTSVEAAISHGRTTSDRAPEQQEARVDLTVTQALLRGARPAANFARVRIAELDAAISVHELRGFAEALVAETEIDYWRFVLAREAIAIYESSLGLARRQAGEIERRIAVGMLAETEAAAARAEVALREQALIDARSEREERRLRLLRRLDPGEGGGEDRPLEPSTAPGIPGEEAGGPVEDRLALAERMRPELAEARLRLEQNRLETVATRDGLLPRLDLFAALGKSGFGDRFGPTFGEIGGDAHEVTVGVSFRHFLGNRAARARDRAAAASHLQAAVAVRNLRSRVRLEVRLAANEVERARRAIAASRTTREWQEKTLEAEERRFDVGTGTALLVAQAQRDLLAARIAEVEAVVLHRIALVDLYRAEGSLLDRRGVSVGPPAGE